MDLVFRISRLKDHVSPLLKMPVNKIMQSNAVHDITFPAKSNRRLKIAVRTTDERWFVNSQQDIKLVVWKSRPIDLFNDLNEIGGHIYILLGHVRESTFCFSDSPRSHFPLK